MMRSMVLVLAGCSLFFAACVTFPQGPGLSVVPGTGKTLAEFQHDDLLCRDFASQQISGVTAANAGASSAITSAAVGTALGAAAGAAFGGGHGAAIGAGSGLLAGSALGAGAAAASAGEVQRRYDVGYAQCMSTQGNRPPRTAYAAPYAAPSPPPPPPAYAYIPPPPPVYTYGPPYPGRYCCGYHGRYRYYGY